MLYHKTVRLSEIVPVDVHCKAYTLERNGPRFLYLRFCKHTMDFQPCSLEKDRYSKSYNLSLS